MTVRADLPAAASFLAAHGRLLDRLRLQLLLGEGDPDGVLAALDAYRNPDGGYGWGLEPDLRSAGSQPAAAMHALEVLGGVAPVTSPRAAELCGWLQQHTLADGGLPFALPIADPVACAPFWVQADRGTASLQMTAQVAAKAHLLGRHHPDVASHPWLARATEYCLGALRRMDDAPHVYELMFALHLHAVADRVPAPATCSTSSAGTCPPRARCTSRGAPRTRCCTRWISPPTGWPVRELFPDDVVAADLERLAGQQPDGGWLVHFTSYSPAAALEWRGYATVRAVELLRSNAH